MNPHEEKTDAQADDEELPSVQARQIPSPEPKDTPLDEIPSSAETEDRAEETEEPASVTDTGLESEDSRQTPGWPQGTYQETLVPTQLPSEGVHDGMLPELSVQEKADAIRIMVRQGMEVCLEHVGRYLLVYEFNGDTQQVFSKRPNKGKRSLSEIARHLHGVMTRQHLADCVRAVAFIHEAEAQGLETTSLSFSHKIVLGRLKDAKERMALAKEAIERRFTVQQVKDRVREALTGVSSGDRALGKAAMRRVSDMLRFAMDVEMQDFLRDKNRVKAALKKADRLKMLDHSEQARSKIPHFEPMLEQLERTLVEITIPMALSGHSTAEDESEGDADEGEGS